MSGEQSNPVATNPKPVNWERRLLRPVLIYAGIPYVVIVVYMGFAQRWMIYQPKKTDRLLAKDDVGIGLPVDDVEIQAGKGLTLHGWRFHAAPSAETGPKFVVIYFPGNAGCRADRVVDCRDFAELGCDVVLFDYRGYGDNGGSPSETTLASDARRVWLFVTDELHFPPERIVVFGESLGGGVATRLAAEFSQIETPPAALILNSTFSSLAETVAWHYPAFPFQYILLDRYPSIDRIPRVTCPILQFHGTADETIAYNHGRRLFDAAPAKSNSGVEKQFVEVPGGQHNSVSINDLQGTVKELFKKLGEIASEK